MAASDTLTRANDIIRELLEFGDASQQTDWFERPGRRKVDVTNVICFEDCDQTFRLRDAVMICSADYERRGVSVKAYGGRSNGPDTRFFCCDVHFIYWTDSLAPPAPKL